MQQGLEWGHVRDFLIAMLIGLLVGIDRERRKAELNQPGGQGIRTFTLFALVGALGSWLSLQFKTPLFLAVTLLTLAACTVAGYLAQVQRDPESGGLTTEVATLAVALLGALAVAGQAPLAVVLGIAVSVLLAYKHPIHTAVRQLDTLDIYAGLKLLIASFIVLPLLPNRTIDPLDAINPYKLWLLVVMISGLSLAGYVATRWLGSERGMAVTGISGGLVSSTAVTLYFARRSREIGTEPHTTSALAIGILLAWLVMFGRVVVEVAVVNLNLVVPVLIPCAAMGLTTLVCAGALMMFRRKSQGESSHSSSALKLKNPFSLRAAVKFALFFTLVLVLVKLAQRYLPGQGIYAVAALAGLTDVDAITLSMADAAKQGSDAALISVRAITIASLANTLTKTGMVAVLGTGALRKQLLAAALLILLAGVGSLFLLPAP